MTTAQKNQIEWLSQLGLEFTNVRDSYGMKIGRVVNERLCFVATLTIGKRGKVRWQGYSWGYPVKGEGVRSLATWRN